MPLPYSNPQYYFYIHTSLNVAKDDDSHLISENGGWIALYDDDICSRLAVAELNRKRNESFNWFFFRSSRLARVVNLLMENPNYFLLLGWLCCSLESLTMICLQLFNVILRIVELRVCLSDSYKEFTSCSQIHIVMNPDYRKYIFSSYYKSATN